jgi:hypothetical protein
MELFPSLSDTDVSTPDSGGDAAMRVAVAVDKNAAPYEVESRVSRVTVLRDFQVTIRYFVIVSSSAHPNWSLGSLLAHPRAPTKAPTFQHLDNDIQYSITSPPLSSELHWVTPGTLFKHIQYL